MEDSSITLQIEGTSITLEMEDASTTLEGYQCPLCDKTLKNKYGLNKHLKTHTAEKPYSCEVCGKCFKTKKYLTKHMSTTHTDQKLYACEICHKSFKFRESMYKHIKGHTGERNFKCDICGAAFMRLITLQTHQRIHSDIKPYACRICGKQFRHYPSQIRHEATVHRKNPSGSKPYACRICGRKFCFKASQKKHEATVHKDESTDALNATDENERVAGAEGDGMVGESSESVPNQDTSADMNQHLSGKVQHYKCDKCEALFQIKSNFDEHMLHHDSIGKFTCSVCGSRFMQESTLRFHISYLHQSNSEVQIDFSRLVNSASQSLSDSCVEQAGASSSAQSASQTTTATTTTQVLSGAIKQQDGDSNSDIWKCDKCDSIFSVKTALRKHQRRNCGNWEVACGVCDKRFFDHAAYVNHISMDHQKPSTEIVYECIPCKKYFTKASLVKHNMLYHGEIEFDSLSSIRTVSVETVQFKESTIKTRNRNGSQDNELSEESNTNKSKIHRKTQTPTSSKKSKSTQVRKRVVPAKSNKVMKSKSTQVVDSSIHKKRLTSSASQTSSASLKSKSMHAGSDTFDIIIVTNMISSATRNLQKSIADTVERCEKLENSNSEYASKLESVTNKLDSIHAKIDQLIPLKKTGTIRNAPNGTKASISGGFESPISGVKLTSITQDSTSSPAISEPRKVTVSTAEDSSLPSAGKLQFAGMEDLTASKPKTSSRTATTPPASSESIQYSGIVLVPVEAMEKSNIDLNQS